MSAMYICYEYDGEHCMLCGVRAPNGDDLGVDEAVGHLNTLTADLARVTAERDALRRIVDEDFDGFMFDGLERTSDGHLELRTHHERSKLLRTFCAHMIEVLDGEGCENYLETQIVMRPAEVERLVENPTCSADFTPGPPGFVLTLRRYDGATPHELRIEAEAERNEALALLREWRGGWDARLGICQRTDALLAKVQA